MAFEGGTKVKDRSDHSPSSRALPEPTPPEATSLPLPDEVSPRTLSDAAEVIRAFYYATADMIEAVYLR
jgi:hypothetical protein